MSWRLGGGFLKHFLTHLTSLLNPFRQSADKFIGVALIKVSETSLRK